MDYFIRNYENFSLAHGKPDSYGFRNPQKGAIHAVVSHFTISSDPAIVSLPTGSGKTAVLLSLPFWLRARRVLVLAPSRLLRSQLAEEIRSIRQLVLLKALPQDTPGPSVLEITSQITDRDTWNQLVVYDIAVSTPYCVSPAIRDIAQPPEDLFDVVVVDEAHHTPAKTWNAALEAFPKAKKILLTATPYRRDRKEIAGKIVYDYPLTYALRDGIYSKIEFHPVELTPGADPDEAVAEKTEQLFLASRKDGLADQVMVRVDSKKRAAKLAELYERSTSLRLGLVHSNIESATLDRRIRALKDGKLDGVICVNMLGEGFDLTTLKIAAIHHPHKSLANTLQFIGRLARANSATESVARFVAIPSEIEIEKRGLYRADAVWQDLIVEMSEEKLDKEVRARQATRTFEADGIIEQLESISLRAIQPRQHTTVFSLTADRKPRLSAPLKELDQFELVYNTFSSEYACRVAILRRPLRPRWFKGPSLDTSEFFLLIGYFYSRTPLLFVHCSPKNELIVQAFVESVATGPFRRLSMARLNRVLAELSNTEFYNLGLRAKVKSDARESYRIMAGARSERAVRPEHGQWFRRGHLLCSAEDIEGHDVNIGYSTSSKVWGRGLL
ncbi:MAG: DEAD/DEAH box helicase family protein [Thermoanaerobaculia bacterium]|nr:DEAD/DEAH box helicase family protein [Thermoanaerobaculia bacterium]